jgi:hypothetical protein
MPVNLKIGSAEQPAGTGRMVRPVGQDAVEWHAVTTMEDGSEEWNFSRDPAKAAARPGGEWEWKSAFGEKADKDENAVRKIRDVLRREQQERTAWQFAVESARAKAEKREREFEEKQARANEREAHNREALVARRLMRTTVKRLGTAINKVMVGERELVKNEMRPAAGGKRQRRKKAEVMEEATMKSLMVTTRELRAAFSEFLVDAGKDKGLKEPRAYRQWLWMDRNTVYLAPAGRSRRGGQGAGGRVTGSGKPN